MHFTMQLSIQGSPLHSNSWAGPRPVQHHRCQLRTRTVAGAIDPRSAGQNATEAVSHGIGDASAKVQSAQAGLSQSAEAAVRYATSAAKSLLTSSPPQLQGPRSAGALDGTPKEAHFGSSAAQAAWQRAVDAIDAQAPGASQLPSALSELPSRISQELSQVMPQGGSAGSPTDTDGAATFLQNVADALSDAAAHVTAAGTTVEERLEQGLEVLERDPGSLQPHFGTSAIESTLRDAAGSLGWRPGGGGLQLPQLPHFSPPGLPDDVSALPQRLAKQLGELLPGSGGGSGRGVVDGDGALSGLGAAAQSVVDGAASLASSFAGSLMRNVDLLERDPSSLPPHFGTLAAREALHPLTSWAADHGMLLGNPLSGGVRVDASALQRLAVAVLQGGHDLLEGVIHSLAEALQASGAEAQGGRLASQLSDMLMAFEAGGHAGYSAGVLTAITVAVVAALAASVPPNDFDPLSRWVSWGEVPAIYNVPALAQYYTSRPVMVTKRALRLLWAAAQFGSGLAVDYLQGDIYGNSAKRARQLRGHIERLGPAYVKVAQALSTRVDILDANYLQQIELLQDRVPPFPTDDALEVMREAWGRPVEAVLSKISDEPVAAASLGQVYRGRLAGLGGSEVAIKVLRPRVLATVALDLYLMRAAALALQRLPSVRTDWAGLIEEWGKRFFAEMDYEAEAAAADLFAVQMEGLPGIVVPAVYHELTNQRVLTTDWIEGEKLSESRAGDVRQLCNTLLNCYLTQLLETGTLHADPHPGNLIRTPDGKICILDYGLMTEVTPQQSLALVEYISHLSVQDWASVPEDLRKLGFIREDAPDSAAIAEPLGRVLSQLSAGGGAKGLNIDQITRDIEVLTETYPFEVPSYFALILRCFSVIEGIALRVDPQYSIVQECFPYLARRLLADRDPRLQAALKATLYGGKQRMDIPRLQRLASGFSRFTVDGITAPAPALARGEPAAGAPLLDSTARDALRLVFAPEGSYAAELLADEAAAAVDALGRAAAFEVCSAVLGSLPAMAALTARQALPPILQGLLPLPAPVTFLSRLQPLVAPSREDGEALDNVRAIAALLQGAAGLAAFSPPVATAAATTPAGAGAGTSGARAWQLVQEVSQILPELAPGILFTANLFLQRLGSRFVARVVQQGLGGSASGSNGNGINGSVAGSDGVGGVGSSSPVGRGSPSPFGVPPPVYNSWSAKGATRSGDGIMEQLRQFAATPSTSASGPAAPSGQQQQRLGNAEQVAAGVAAAAAAFPAGVLAGLQGALFPPSAPEAEQKVTGATAASKVTASRVRRVPKQP